MAFKEASGAPAPTLRLHEVSIKLPSGADRALAVENISFEVQAGEVVCLLGESGSGKSVIAHAVMGLLPRGVTLEQGKIELVGEALGDKSPAEMAALRGNRMAMVFQEPMTALNPVMRCGHQLEELLKIHGVGSDAERRTRVKALLERVHFHDPDRVYRSFPHQLSGGQRQRVMIAMALLLKPPLLICDEPTTALDVTTQAEILKLVLELRRDHGTAILFITHDIGVVSEIADRVVVMRLGAMVEHGPCSQLLGAPTTDYTRMLIDAVPSLEPQRRQVEAAQEVVLRVKQLCKGYKQGGLFRPKQVTVAAEQVNIEVARGETVGLVGESGSGKSTLARCIADLVPYDSGAIEFEGLDLSSASQREKRKVQHAIQMVFQDPYRSLNPRLTVLESIIEGAVNAGTPRHEAIARARQLMKQVRLPEQVLPRYPHEFSGGQRQRLCIARALACNPRLLIADEAVSALDVSVQKQILELLEDLQKQLGLSMLFITHDLRVAARLCDRVIVMHKGRVVEQGPSSDVLLRPQHEYTRQLVAAVPGRSGLSTFSAVEELAVAEI